MSSYSLALPQYLLNFPMNNFSPTSPHLGLAEACIMVGAADVTYIRVADGDSLCAALFNKS